MHPCGTLLLFSARQLSVFTCAQRCVHANMNLEAASGPGNTAVFLAGLIDDVAISLLHFAET